jgi:tRNA modification GTPase
MYVDDTIAAVSTPVGEGGIGIVRISGKGTEAILARLLHRNKNGGLDSHRFYFDSVVDPINGSCLDEVMVVLMRAPRSYTREDVAEIQCHGGTLVTERILDLVLQSGGRLAEPGEFTKRAFLNGRIDLLQAEAVIDIIRCRTDAALHLAQGQREGELSRRFGQVRGALVTALALVEAFIDFPEDDLDPASLQGITTVVQTALADVEMLLSGYEEGRVLREGVSVLIAGKPNAGKSSLLNILVREKRAIVTAIPGTTRDMIEEVVNIRGLPVRLIDTAGIRETEDLIEQEGVRLTLEKIPRADLVIFLLDGSRPFDSDDLSLLQALGDSHYLTVCNKSDVPRLLVLPPEIDAGPVITISTRSGEGIDDLRSHIAGVFLGGRAVDRRQGGLISRVRHRDALVKTRDALQRFSTNLAARLDPELLAIDLREALEAVGAVTGQTTPDDILDVIFSQFCIGK